MMSIIGLPLNQVSQAAGFPRSNVVAASASPPSKLRQAIDFPNPLSRSATAPQARSTSSTRLKIGSERAVLSILGRVRREERKTEKKKGGKRKEIEMNGIEEERQRQRRRKG
jgi:hypothetical protein